MGLIRRVALDELGGWNEWCITEDAELSIRLLRAGWHGLHVDQSWGYGIMPLTFEALKGQRYWWCFGGIQILRMHWRSMMPGRQGRQNHLAVGQRWAYLAGALQWYGDLLGLLFLIFLLAGAVTLDTGGGQLFRKLTVYWAFQTSRDTALYGPAVMNRHTQRSGFERPLLFCARKSTPATKPVCRRPYGQIAASTSQL